MSRRQYSSPSRPISARVCSFHAASPVYVPSYSKGSSSDGGAVLVELAVRLGRRVVQDGIEFAPQVVDLVLRQDAGLFGIVVVAVAVITFLRPDNLAAKVRELEDIISSKGFKDAIEEIVDERLRQQGSENEGGGQGHENQGHEEGGA